LSPTGLQNLPNHLWNCSSMRFVGISVRDLHGYTGQPWLRAAEDEK
jgi:hypothetical protein